MPRQSLQSSASKPSPLRIVLYTLPVWIFFIVLMFAMPMTGLIGAIVVAFCLLVLPFKARRGACPECGKFKLFPFSGFGSVCKGCSNELVLRGKTIHLLEPRDRRDKAGSGRGNGQTFKS